MFRLILSLFAVLAVAAAASSDPPVAVDDEFSADTAGRYTPPGGWLQDFYEPSERDTAALADGRIAFTWVDAGDARVLFRDRLGNQAGGEFVAGSNVTGNSAITGVASGGSVVAWVGEDASSPATSPDIMMRRYDASNTALGAAIRVNTGATGEQTNVFVTGLSGGGFAVAWTTPTDLRARFFDVDGFAVTGEIVINTNAIGDLVLSDAMALDDGGVVFGWSRELEVRTRAFDATGGEIIPERTIALNTFETPRGHAFMDGGGVCFFTQTYSGSANSQRIFVYCYDAAGNVTVPRTNTGVGYGLPQESFRLISVAGIGDGQAVIAFTRSNGWFVRLVDTDLRAVRDLYPDTAPISHYDGRVVALEDGRFLITNYDFITDIGATRTGYVFAAEDLRPDRAYRLFVTINDRETAGLPLTITDIAGNGVQTSTLPSGARVQASGGTVLYDPTNAPFAINLGDGESASDSFEYTVSNGTSTDTATVRVFIGGMRFNLTAATTGLGTGSVSNADLTINCGNGGSACSRTFEQNTNVELYATPANGSRFDGWSGTCTGTGDCIVPMTQAQSVTARFEIDNPPDGRIVAATLPGARSGYVGGPDLTAYMTVVSRATTPAQDCRIAAPGGAPFAFTYRQLDSSNQPTGSADPHFDLGNGQSSGFVLSMSPQTATDAAGYLFQPQIACDNADLAPIPGVNSILVSIGNAPVPDILSIGATVSGDGVVRIPSSGNRISFMSASAVNIGAGDGSAGAGQVTATVSVDTGGAVLPVTLEVCETDSSGACTTPRGETSLTTVFSGSNARTFAVFVRANAGATVPFDPANARVYLRFTEATGTVRSVTSAAISAP